ncbi:MAG TPA: hypothetical protein PLX89_22490, partial [Verrucomicrobiota bacterium]|nr:hypothetical protein [Verrucomicrobiota bacterium]
RNARGGRAPHFLLHGYGLVARELSTWFTSKGFRPYVAKQIQSTPSKRGNSPVLQPAAVF